ncbi:Smr/MutS family protein [Rhodobacteraceae bacterium]|nr:Smr/MutS family protein [Paracoccaceae bacterium]
MSRKPRGLRPEEERLWQRVADTAKPLGKNPSKPRLTAPIKKPGVAPTPKPERYSPPRFRVGETASTAMPPMVHSREEPLRMDKKSFTKMKRGKSAPEARIDLHGMTAASAHTALTSFLLRSHGQGFRLVLVITGKGRRSKDDGPVPQRVGVLRQQLPHWISIPPLNQVVLQVTEAHQRHGGSGAFYIYLSRHR